MLIFFTLDLKSDEFITGFIEGEFGNDKGVFGNLTVRLYARNDNMQKWTLVSTLDVEVVSGTGPVEEGNAMGVLQ